MPTIKEHIKTSLKRTGKSYKELHAWMDEEYKYGKHEIHNITNIQKNTEIVRRKYGDEGVSEFLYHIKNDCDSNKPKKIIAILKNIFGI